MAFLNDGFSTVVTVSLTPSLILTLREKEVQPPDLDGGGPIETTTMRNTLVRTKQPKKLTTIGDLVMHCQYDPAEYAAFILGHGQRIGFCSVTFPDGSTLGFFGWVESFKPSSHKEGEFPTAEVKIIPSNQLPRPADPQTVASASFPGPVAAIGPDGTSVIISP